MSDEIALRRMVALDADGDGNTVRFRIEGDAERSVEVSCSPDLVATVIGFLIELARGAAARRPAASRHSFARSEAIEVVPNPVSNATFMVDPETSEIVLALRMSGFDLGFSLTPEHLLSLKRELDRILPALGIAEPGPDPGHHHGGHHHHH